MTQPAETPKQDALAKAAEPSTRALAVFDNDADFITSHRMAKALAASTMVPTVYVNSVPNCLVALELASRIRCSVLLVMQHLAIVQGKTSLSGQFLTAIVNSNGRFTPIRYKWQSAEGKEDWGCRAYATELSTGEVLTGPLITIKLAKAEGWFQKNGSKWQTIPELMLMYRAAAWWVRTQCPELGMGMQTTEEVQDVGETETPVALQVGNPQTLEDALRAVAKSEPPPAMTAEESAPSREPGED